MLYYEQSFDNMQMEDDGHAHVIAGALNSRHPKLQLVVPSLSLVHIATMETQLMTVLDDM